MKKFLSNKKGVSTVEFALTVAFYFFVVCLILEFCRVAITSSYWDLAITESTRIAKNQSAPGDDYKKAFETALRQQAVAQEKSTIGYLVQLNNGGIEIDVKYVNCSRETCIKALLNNDFRTPKVVNGKLVDPNGALATLAVYTVKYKYKFLTLPFLPADMVEHALERKIIAVQEFGRSLFLPNAAGG
ncbi:protein TadE [Aggregatibacter aphrophilus NJ8700]|uniref:TadE/TadG family type IV pilus assembly protein n=1 Tax=Aggregatibacter aphrophilus TaxID=732 RepID=UPI0001AAE579|nr:TadE family protein [Aggregatibacter aphrophilus]ACS96617.1 TadE [Aggregatibacter aphrophilus NJ8700]AKS64019.1 protein TadE [Aggregatibacter aphrophilus NJ8700]EHB90163.1 hypothetical protein HMPREF9335_01024 [Aggregatibacter aphrophilus F0387]